MRVLTTNNKTSWDSGVSGTLFVYKDRKVNALKILIVEDNILKFSKIRRVLNDLCHAEIEHVEALEPAKKMFIEALNKNEFYDLVVTDVHFPNEKNGSEVADAGFQLIEYMKEKRPEQPIIVCSSVRYSAQGILGTVLYSDNTDLRFEFQKIIDKITQ